jgi:uncharacterized repeat protein (TIGR01451 family)
MTGLQSLSFGYGSHINFLNFEDAVNLRHISFYQAHQAMTLDLSHATQLESFSAESTDFTGLNLAGLVNLVSFKCENRVAFTTNLNIDDLTAMKNFTLEGAEVTSINFDHNILLESLSCRNNNLITIDLSHLPNLKTLDCSENQLIALDLSNNLNLERLVMTDNLLTAIDLTQLHKVQSVYATNNLFTTLDFSGFTDYLTNAIQEVPYYFVDGNPNLIHVNIKNGKKDYVRVYNDCPNFIYICVDETDLPGQNLNLQQSGATTIQANTYCSFYLGGNFNTITGTLALDSDNNGCDANDDIIPNSRLQISSTAQNQTTYTHSNGTYDFYTLDGSFVVTPEFENPYYTISPPNVTVNFADNNNHIETQNFCIIPNGIHKDLEITIVPQNARPGFDSNYNLVYKNKGNQILSGNIALTFDDARLDFVSAFPQVDTQSLNQLGWSYTNLKPFESRSIVFTLNVNSPQETPAVNIGDILNFNVTINPVSGDETSADNTFTLNQTVTGSFDPNDKTCLEGNTITPEMVGGYLHYLIRFQNSGTAAAENIVVKDIIDTTKFDIASLQLTSSSHPQVTKITGNKVEFQFESINLPAEIDDEPGSHGYIAFKIKTKNSLVIGNSVANKADIYFDYNFPIETNAATSTVALLGLNTFENTSVTLAPNPTKGMVQINSKDKITTIQLFDLQGRIIQSTTANTLTTDFDLSQQRTGIYFLRIYTGKGVKVEKIMKE